MSNFGRPAGPSVKSGTPFDTCVKVSADAGPSRCQNVKVSDTAGPLCVQFSKKGRHSCQSWSADITLYGYSCTAGVHEMRGCPRGLVLRFRFRPRIRFREFVRIRARNSDRFRGGSNSDVTSYNHRGAPLPTPRPCSLHRPAFSPPPP